ncbi:SDR family NAD(P)-dependent oxidoreductase [Shewanella colwelliana]|uniref:SDR family NAD(P)-dependent oxidoreductase n=1 Tax=Shewanella colwelliana TaxID=23 RepID=UPI001C7D9882|nr:SDR family NAD(P)-dependent oxidoreductase [Shewanella colwelliana]
MKEVSEPEVCSGVSVVIGASSVIAKALIEHLLMQGPVIAISRQALTYTAKRPKSIQSGYSEGEIAALVSELARQKHVISNVFIFNGILHQDRVKPEKRLEDLSEEAMNTLFKINTITPMMWLKHLMPLVKGDRKCVIAVMSARIGSISDNRLGGWYSYRASKAALNMLLQTSAVEYARRAKNVAILAFHPGTTDTPLSKPFLQNVPKEKLFSPDFVAERLLAVTQTVTPSAQAYFIDWNGDAILW